MKTAVFFPGLAADHRLFSAMEAGRWPVTIIPALVPLDGESIEHYALRIARVLPEKQPLIFVGVSFGGILAQEVAKVLPAERIILISGISSRKQLPAFYGIFRILPLYDWLPERLFKKLVLWIGGRYTTKSREERALFESMVWDADMRLIRWGIRQVLYWKQVSPACPVVHIHGARDRVFPLRLIPAEYVVEDGQHFMIVQQPHIIKRLLLDMLS